eukprot:gene5886-6127_t
MVFGNARAVAALWQRFVLQGAADGLLDVELELLLAEFAFVEQEADAEMRAAFVLVSEPGL